MFLLLVLKLLRFFAKYEFFLNLEDQVQFLQQKRKQTNFFHQIKCAECGVTKTKRVTNIQIA